MSYITVDDLLGQRLAAQRSRNPNKGDIVRATVKGDYSHQGDNLLSAGFHIVKVDKRDVALPPDTEFEVVKRWQPPEPPYGSIVQNTRTGNFWQLDGPDLLGRFWSCISNIGVDRLTWQALLSVTDNGRALVIYHPAEVT